MQCVFCQPHETATCRCAHDDSLIRKCLAGRRQSDDGLSRFRHRDLQEACSQWRKNAGFCRSVGLARRSRSGWAG